MAGLNVTKEGPENEKENERKLVFAHILKITEIEFSHHHE